MVVIHVYSEGRSDGKSQQDQGAHRAFIESLVEEIPVWLGPSLAVGICLGCQHCDPKNSVG